MYNLTLPKNCSSNCFDSIFYSLLKYFGYDYKIYNIKYYYNNYYNTHSHDICRGNSSLNILKGVYGITTLFNDRKYMINIFDIVCTSLNKTPVGIVIDPYYCHWSPFFQKSHHNHAFLIVDIDYYNKQYICFDVHYNSTGYIKVDFDLINNHLIRYFTFRFNNTNEISFQLVLKKIETIVNSFDNNIDSKKAELFNYFTQTSRAILFPNGIVTSPVLINLMWIAEDKKHSQILFKYLEEKTNQFNFASVYELLTDSERKFTLLKTILMKYAMTGMLKESTLKNIIDQIFDTDVLMISELKNILGG